LLSDNVCYSVNIFTRGRLHCDLFVYYNSKIISLYKEFVTFQINTVFFLLINFSEGFVLKFIFTFLMPLTIGTNFTTN
jgi:hypothetical protein